PPPAEAVKLRPLKEMLLPETCPAATAGTGPPPVSMETTASRVRFAASTRFVMLTGRKMVRLPLNTDPGVAPEHCRKISPTRSARPSARTCTGALVTWQRPLKEDVCACAAHARTQRGRTRASARLPIGVRGAIETHFIGTRLHVEDAG